MSYEAGLIGSVVANAYDEVLYPGYPILQAHPNRLATLATLFGMEPASIQSCRVLELGCGDGANLIPMAFGLPASHFVGVDAAARPLAKGQVMIKSLGLKNIILHHSSVIDVAPELGQFDYIIAHGLYSWVPAAVQDKLLSGIEMDIVLEDHLVGWITRFDHLRGTDSWRWRCSSRARQTNDVKLERKALMAAFWRLANRHCWKCLLQRQLKRYPTVGDDLPVMMRWINRHSFSSC